MASGVGTATLDFGATATSEASVAIAGQSDISASSRVEAWMMARTTSDNSADDHKQAAAFMRFVCSEPTPGVGFTLTGYCMIGQATGRFSVEYTWSD